MDLSHWIWLGLACYAVHMLEEFILDWRGWARAVIKLPVEWQDFYVTNGIVVVLGIAFANLAAVAPAIALGFPALMLINAVLFHILPVIFCKGRYSPGVFTAVVLFLPVGYLSFRAAAQAGALDASTLILSFLVGAGLMAMPIVLLHLRAWPYFRQDKP